jgi:non-ribosomal peptide synthetase component F
VFSAAQRTIWTTLVHGGCLCIASKESLLSSLSATVSRLNVNQLGVTPTTARLLSPESVPSLKRLTLTGERVPEEVVRLWADKLDLRTGYGLSEVTQLVWTASLSHDSTPNNIGRPKDTTSAYVLIPGTLKLAPILIAGELCLAGHQLARSYLNRPEETAAKFIKNPFGSGRLYRTGDLAIQREDGSIEILGRIDRQVKIAGQRVEPEEVATVVRNSPVVKDAAVVPITLDSELVLVACIVLKASAPADALEMVRNEARRVLPLYAVPFFVPLDTLPVNHNGKTDFFALQKHLTSIGRQGMLRLAQVDVSLPAGQEHASWTEAQQIMRKIWSTILSLDIETIRQTDSFLSLGGSSLRAIQVSIACRDEGMDVPAADIIRTESLASLIECMQQNSKTKDTTLTPRVPMIDMSLMDTSIKSDEYVDILPVSPLQEAVVATTLSGAPEYTYQRVYKIKDIDLTRLKAAFDSVSHTQSILRTTFLPYGSSYVQAVLSDSLPWSEHEESLDEFMASDLERGFVAKEHFCRVAVFPSQSLLVFTSHHALFDFWSNTFVLDDVAKVYHGHSPIYRPSYRSFIEHLSSSPVEDSRKFWAEYLDGASTSRIGTVAGPKHVSERILDVDITHFLASHSITSGALIYAAWALIVAAHTSSSDVTFGTTLSGRDIPVKDVHLMNGPTLTTVPQRIQIEFTQNAVEYVSTVQKRLWTMNEHSQFGMRNALRASHQTSSLFDTLVNLLMSKQTANETLSVFQPYGPSPAWETEYTTLEAIPDGSAFRFRLISHLESRRSDFIIDSLIAVIKSFVTDPHIKLADIELVGPAEMEHLESLSPPIPIPESSSFLHSSFEEFAHKKPRKIAIQWEDNERISYHQLNSQANCLAAFLRKRGVGPNVKVPLCLEK